jgi:uncharacterized membrane protein YkoI
MAPNRLDPSEPRRMSMNTKRIKMAIGATAVAAVIAGGTVAATASGSESDAPLTGSTREQAIAAALAHVGGGTVLSTEVGDDGAAYGVEIRLTDGSAVEVMLDERFQIVTTETDDDGPGGEGPAGDDG